MIRCVLCLEISEPFDSDKVKKWRVLRRIIVRIVRRRVVVRVVKKKKCFGELLW